MWFNNFLKNRTIIWLEDKLSPDFYHGFFWSEENVVLNYFPTQDGVWVLVCPLILVGHMIILIDLMAGVKPLFVIFFHITLADVTARMTVAYLVAYIIGRCY